MSVKGRFIGPISISRDMPASEIEKILPFKLTDIIGGRNVRPRLIRSRCFLHVDAEWSNSTAVTIIAPPDAINLNLRRIIHVPALRGNPVRTYKTTAIGDEFSGTFEPYVASIIHHWQTTRDIRLKQLGNALHKLGLT